MTALLDIEIKVAKHYFRERTGLGDDKWNSLPDSTRQRFIEEAVADLNEYYNERRKEERGKWRKEKRYIKPRKN